MINRQGIVFIPKMSFQLVWNLSSEGFWTSQNDRNLLRYRFYL